MYKQWIELKILSFFIEVFSKNDYINIMVYYFNIINILNKKI